MSRILVSAFLFAFFGFGSVVASVGAQDSLNCDDFPNQDAAQDNLIANPGDPNGLDANDNGIACESFFGGGDSSGSGGGGDDSDSGEVAEEDTSSDDADAVDDVAELPETGTGPLASSSETLIAMLAASALLCGAVATTVRFRIR